MCILESDMRIIIVVEDLYGLLLLFYLNCLSKCFINYMNRYFGVIVVFYFSIDIM